MKKKMFLMAFAAILSINLHAQQQRQRMSEEERQKARTERIQKNAERLAKDFSLKDDAKTSFIATYTEYQEALQGVQDGNRQEGNGESNESKSKQLTDEEATAQIEQQFTRQEQQIEQSKQRLEISKKYYAEFQKTLTPQQLVKIFGQQRQQRQGNQQGGPQGDRGGFGPQGGPQGMGGGFGGDF